MRSGAELAWHAAGSATAGPGLALVEGYTWALRDRGVVCAGLAGGEPRAIAIEGASAVVGAGGSAWVRAMGAVQQFTPEGTLVATRAVEPNAAGGALTACRIGAGAVVAQGPRPVWIDPGGVRALGDTAEYVIPVPEGVVMRVGRRLALRGGRGCVPLDVPSDLLANASLCGGAALRGGVVGLELRSRNAHHLIAIDLQTHAVAMRLRLTGARAVAWIEERGHAVVVRERELLVLDLEHGKCVMTRRLDEPVAAVAADERGRALVLAHGEQIAVIDYAELVGTPAPLPRPVAARRTAAAMSLDGERARDEDDAHRALRPAAPEIMPEAMAVDAPESLPEALAVAAPAALLEATPVAAPESMAVAAPEAKAAAAPAALPEAMAIAPPESMAVAAPLATAGEPTDVADDGRSVHEGRAEQQGIDRGCAGLALLPMPPPIAEAHLARFLADAFALVAAMCRRAVAEAWDCGRFGTGGVLPYADEVAATLDGADGRTPEAVELARGREQAAELRFAQHEVAEMPLGNLAVEHGLSDLAARIALLVAAPRMWPELARIYAIISNDRARPLVDELLLAQLLGVARTDRRSIAQALAPGAPLVRHGIVLRGSGEPAFASLSVPAVVALRLAGDRFERGPDVRAATVGLGEIFAPGGRLDALCADLAAPRPAPARIVLRGRTGSGRRTLAAALAATAGRCAGLVQLAPTAASAPDDALRADLRDAALRGHLPCVSGLDALGDDPTIQGRLQRVLDEHPGPLVVRCEPGTRPPLAPGAHVIELDGLDEVDRAAAWRAALARHGLGPEPAAALAGRWTVGPGTAVSAAALVARNAAAPVTTATLDAAVRRLRADRLAGLADKVEHLATWGELVLPDDMLDSLRELIARVRHRRVVLGEWGMARVSSTARALTALFQGGPGTGKTLAAGVLARELGYDLYRVDISRVMSR
ncbi:MAG TPA: AAA family ATPase, partial [Kofleriaceae bacterium]|nr:AAA family ATPase [Kofleriaceae bacterium]